MKSKYIIIAGVNGAGKTTLYDSQNQWSALPRVNIDELARENGSWQDIHNVTKAGVKAVRMLKNYMNKEISFNQETTLCGKSIFHNIQIARQKGYLIELHYVGVDSVEIAKERISYRVKHGGHGIPDADVERRYIETFVNLQRILPLCDLAVLYDNTKEFRRFAIYKNGTPVRISSNIPEWFKNILS